MIRAGQLSCSPGSFFATQVAARSVLLRSSHGVISNLLQPGEIAMSRLPNEDLFEGSKMSFGEHLEELRLALVRSLMGLAVGVVFGFYFAENVIDFVEEPLLTALDNYYTKKAVDTVTEIYGPGMEQKDLETLQQSIAQDGRVFEDVYFEKSELERLLGLVSGEPASPTSLEPGIPDMELIKTRIWRETAYKVQSISTTEGFLSWMKVGIVTGLTVAAPWIFLQLWVFVAEGLYPTEKRYVYIYLPFSLALFFAGAGVAFFFVFEPVLGFLFSFNETMNSDPVPRISEWLSFFLLLPLGFGIGFQLPLVMLFLNRIGIVTVEAYVKQWRIAILFIFVAAMLLTPADPQSMLLLAMPLTCLYFLGILLCKYLPQRESPFGEGHDVA